MNQPAPAWLAKDCLDIGVFTNNFVAMRDYWGGTVGLAFDHYLPLGGGVRQHRFDCRGSVFKLNHARQDLAARTPGGFLRIYLATANVGEAQTGFDPDGNAVVQVPPGYRGIEQWAIAIATPTERAFLDFYRDTLGLPQVNHWPCAVACGRSLIIGETVADAPVDAPVDAPDGTANGVGETRSSSTEGVIDADMVGLGIRYITLQVDKVDKVHARVVAAGGTQGREPRTLGETARVSFVRDGCGNWLELSQRASITGSLEP